MVLIILALARRMDDTPGEKDARLDIVGTLLSALGLALVVFGVLSSGSWGFIIPKPGAPELLGLSPVIWLILAGGCVLAGFLGWERRRLGRGQGVLVDPAMLDNKLLRGGLVSFFFQYLLQAGLFFVVPLFLSVALGLSAIATGVQLLPLSITLLLAAAGVPRVFPNANPRRVVRIGFLALFASTVILIALLDLGAGPEIITGPMLLAGLGVGALASQLGAVTVSAVPDEQSGEVGGLQNTVTNLGASIGIALAGAVLISALTGSFFAGIQDNPAFQKRSTSNAQVELGNGIPFISDTDLRKALEDAGVPAATADAIVERKRTIPARRPTCLTFGLGDIRHTCLRLRHRNTNPPTRRGAPDRQRRLSGEYLTWRSQDGSCSPPGELAAEPLQDFVLPFAPPPCATRKCHRAWRNRSRPARCGSASNRRPPTAKHFGAVFQPDDLAPGT